MYDRPNPIPIHAHNFRSTVHCIFSPTSLCQNAPLFIYDGIHCAESFVPPHPTTLNTHTHFTIKTSPTTHANTVTFITSDFRIHEYLISLAEKLSKQNAKKSAYNQCNLNRIDLNSNNPPWFPAAAEFACVGLHLFEGVRACSALFTVKRMKMNSQIVLHL